MASNLSTIGFEFIDEEQFLSTMNKLAQNAQPAANGAPYRVWTDNSGAEIWFHVKRDTGEPVGLTPFLTGPTQTSATIVDQLNQNDDTEFEGLLVAEVTEKMPYPVIFECPDFAAFTATVPAAVTVHLTLFAGSLRAFPTADAFEQAQDEDAKFAAKSFVQLGLIRAEEEEPSTASNAHCMITGTLIRAEKTTNSISKNDFFSLSIESLDATFDVAADPSVVEGSLEIGSTIDVTGTMFGRVTAEF